MPTRQGIRQQACQLKAGEHPSCRTAQSCHGMGHTSASRSPNRVGQHKQTSRLRLQDCDEFRNLRLRERLQRFDDTAR